MKLYHLILCLGALCLLTQTGYAELVGYWKLDDGAGTVATDASGKGHHGTLIGGPTWGTGQLGGALRFKGSGQKVDIPYSAELNPPEFTVGLWAYADAGGSDYRSPLTTREGSPDRGGYMLYITPSNAWQFWIGVTSGWGQTAGPAAKFNEWTHVAASYTGGQNKLYINGSLAGQSTATMTLNTQRVLRLGGGATESTGAGNYWWLGLIDDVQLYNHALSEARIKDMMKGVSGQPLAVDPKPTNAATDVPRDTALSWAAGPAIATHDVYFGTVFADVNDAGRTNPQGVLASQGQSATTYEPAGPLAYGQTYYWRIDEVNQTPDNTIFKGDIWSFTAEPYAYPVQPIAARASSAQVGMGPERTIDGSGLTRDLHGTEPTTMWMSAGVPPNWIQYEFDTVYKLHELRVWNSNQLIEAFVGFGAKNVAIETSTDGAIWTAVANVPEFTRATGTAGYAANTTVPLGGILAKYVKLTINSTWGGMSAVGLSEVQFSHVPVQARAPQPAAGATDVGIDTGLDWRPGREAASHTVYFGTDREAMADGTAPAKTVTDHRYDPGPLTFGTTYFWKVDEVNAVTYPGDLWSFTTQEYAIVDDFESYTDNEGNRIYETWIDGWENKTGSVVGYMQAPFAERTIVHGGKQSMPLEYNNVKTPYYSEVERTFTSAQNWTGSGADTLVLWFQGRAPGFLETAGGTIIMGGGGADIWGTADQFRFTGKRLTGNGTIVAKVESMVNTDPWAKIGVMIRETKAAGARFAAVYATPGNGVRFQARLMTDAAATSDTAVATPEQMALRAPVWVKLERMDSTFNGFYSTDGIKWTAMSWNPQMINMSAPSVYLGLAVNSHNVNALTTAEFSHISMTGNVTGGWEVAEIGVAQPSNSADQLYVAVQDSAGKVKVVNHPDPAATALANWRQWQIPLSEFTAAGVNLTRVKTLTIGAGDRTSPKPGGAGILYLDDIGYGKPLP